MHSRLPIVTAVLATSDVPGPCGSHPEHDLWASPAAAPATPDSALPPPAPPPASVPAAAVLRGSAPLCACPAAGAGAGLRRRGRPGAAARAGGPPAAPPHAGRTTDRARHGDACQPSFFF